MQNTYETLKETVVDDVINGDARDRGEVYGRMAFEIAGALGGSGGTKAAAEGGRAAEFVQDAASPLKKAIDAAETTADIADNLLDEGVGSGTYVLPNAEDLKMSQTVQNHMNDVIKKGPNAGQLSRPYIDSDSTTLLLKEIMESGNPVPDTTLQSVLRWDVSGTFRGSTGTWELVVDTSTNTVGHFNFVAQ